MGDLTREIADPQRSSENNDGDVSAPKPEACSVVLGAVASRDRTSGRSWGSLQLQSLAIAERTKNQGYFYPGFERCRCLTPTRMADPLVNITHKTANEQLVTIIFNSPIFCATTIGLTCRRGCPSEMFL